MGDMDALVWPFVASEALMHEKPILKLLDPRSASLQVAPSVLHRRVRRARALPRVSMLHSSLPVSILRVSSSHL